MVHHRCTRCKQESDHRSKYFGGVFCDDCMRWIASRGHIKVPHSSRSWLGRMWDKVVDFASSVFQGKPVKRVSMIEERASHAQVKAMEARARSIPYNPQGGVPQKR